MTSPAAAPKRPDNRGHKSAILVVGEALVDVVTDVDGTQRHHPGGSPANVALGLARLGRPVHLLSWFGTDAHGQLLRDHLTESGVTLVPGSTDAPRTSTASATLSTDGAATYEFDLDWRVPRTPLPQPLLAVHTGSIGAVLQPGAATVDRVMMGARHNATITFDPNVRPDIMGSARTTRPRIEMHVAASDVVKASDEDLAWLAPGIDPIDVAKSWLRLGPAVVVVTRGAAGSIGVFSGGQVEVLAPPVAVVDTVGAGDSYMAGLIDALWKADFLGAHRRPKLRQITARQLRSAMIAAAKIAAITVSRAGANPPTRAELTAAEDLDTAHH